MALILPSMANTDENELQIGNLDANDLCAHLYSRGCHRPRHRQMQQGQRGIRRRQPPPSIVNDAYSSSHD